MIDCRLSISSRGDGWTSDNVLRASMEISDNFATIAYKLEGDDCLLTLSPERAEQVRRGGADIKLSFVPNAKTLCVIGDEALRGGYEIFCTRLSVLIKKRGENIIFKFHMDGLDICHLGDLGEDCSPDLIEMILPVNVLLIPVGGNYTIDAKMAKEYVDRIMPDIVIPMHYRAKGCKLDIDKVDDFLDEFNGENVEIVEAGSEIEISRHDLGKDTTTIIVMETEQ